jgi:predicted metal-dependent HD superfamily phosphohydrolase
MPMKARYLEQILQIKKIWDTVFVPSKVPVRQSNATFRFVVELYCDNNRHYHGLNHIAECYDVLDMFDFKIEDRPSLDFAIALHDAIYCFDVPQNNETSSAAFACCIASSFGMDKDFQVLVDRNIRATIHCADAGLAGDAAVVADVDLYGLGKPYEEYVLNTKLIREEHPHISDRQFFNSRAIFIKGLLSRRFIYSTELFRTELERKARQNLSRELSEIANYLKELEAAQHVNK